MALKLELRVPEWRSYIPILDVITRYRRRDFNHDLVAGLVVGLITVPQAIAYAFLAGLPAEAGLYASLAPMLVYAVLGSSRELVVGPVAIAALMVAAAVGQHADAYSDDYLGITTVLCLEVGIFLLLLRLSQMSGIVNLLSHPVITGFVNAAALLIIISQLPALTGIDSPGSENPFTSLLHLAGQLSEVNLVALGVGVIAFALLWLTQHYGFYAVLPFLNRVGRRHPVTRVGPVLVAILAILAVSLFQLDTNFGLETVGHVRGGLPSLTLPPFDFGLWVDLAPSAAMIALVAFVESFSIGTTLASRKRRRIKANQELIALGAANISAAFTGAYPVAGSFSRSSVNYAAGARTPISTVVCAAVVVLTLAFFTPYLARLPHAALSAIIIVSVAGLIDFSSLKRGWAFYPHDTITHLVTLSGVLLLGVEAGLLFGVIVAVAFFVHRSSRPHIAVVGRISDTSHFRDIDRHDVETFAHVAAVRVDENLYFANANQVENRFLKIIQEQPHVRHLLLVCSAVNFIDSSGLEMLRRMNDNLSRMGIRLHMSHVKGPVMDQLKTTDFAKSLTGEIFFTTDQAMRDLGERV
jgi:SulP family sulfate permease